MGAVSSDVAVLAYIVASVGGTSSSNDIEQQQGAEHNLTVPLQKWLCALCRLRAVAPNTSASCELVIPLGGSIATRLSAPASYIVLVELGDGTSIEGRLEVA